MAHIVSSLVGIQHFRGIVVLLVLLIAMGTLGARAKIAYGTTIQSTPVAPLDVDNLRARRMSARPNETIFSPLDLPQPNKIRTATGLPGEEYWQQQADYQIEVSLDAEKESVTAVAHVTYTNNSPESLSYIWISLEQNLFRENSLGAKFTPPGSRFNNRQKFVGGVDVQSVRQGEQDLVLNVYDTMGRIDLLEPLPGRGGKLEFDIAWSFNIPEYGVDRMGIRRVKAGTIFQLAQWFPNICKFDDVHGWNNLPYLGQGEFFTEFGNYDVKITAPRGHVVCATGELNNPKDVLTEKQFLQLQFAKSSRRTIVIRPETELGTDEAAPAGTGPLTWHFKADKVRTFAWTSSDATIWDAASITWEDGGTTLVQSVYPGEARGAWNESTQMLRQSILHYSEMWFRYPYPSAVNVNGNVGGMEYPMIIFCGGDRNKRALHGVTSHEIGHNWFPMVVNTDERRHAWMDEGFNTFINTYDRFGDYDTIVNEAEPAGEIRRASLSTFERSLANADNQPIAIAADQIRPDSLGRLAYSKPGFGMRFLREVILGPERFDPAFKQYIRDWAFKSPQPADFFRCMENAAGMDLAWFWRGWFLENLPLDQAIAAVRENSRTGRATIQIANLKEMVMPVFLQIDFTDGESMNVDLPVQVWNYTNVWTAEIDLGGKTILKVALDRGRVLPDSDRANNVWRRPESAEVTASPAAVKPATEDGSPPPEEVKPQPEEVKSETDEKPESVDIPPADPGETKPIK